MKKILALLIAMIMLFSAAALAEDGTLYSLSLMDPQLTVGEETLDLTGLSLAFTAGVTDYGPLALNFLVSAGEQYDYVTSLFTWLNENCLNVYYDGMENTYSLDLAALTDEETVGILSSLPLRTMLAGTTVEEVETESAGLTAEDRIGLVEAVLGSFVYESLQQDSATVRNFSISREVSAAVIKPLLEMAASASSDLAELSAIDCDIELNGAITTTGSVETGDAVCSVDSEGTLYLTADGEEVAIPMTLGYTDDMSAFKLTLTLTNEGETMSIVLDGAAGALSDGRSSASYMLTLDMAGEQIALAYTAQPEEGTARMDYLLELSIPSEETYLSLSVITDFDSESAYSFYTALTVDDGSGASVMDLYYAGDPTNDPETGLDTVGWAEITLTDPDSEPIAINATVCTVKQDLPSEEWGMYADTVSVLDMTDEEMEAALNEAAAVFQSDIATLMKALPALAEALA